ncbi:MAG: lasso peptide biosynthesis PqqD family chaperone [Bacteroidales bacterium]|nr:lasso peptide biosynthesis PqqD family chaperone [Bacteroidales bacterium]
MGIFTAKMELTPDTILQRKSDLLFNKIDGEIVMLSIENNEYYGMNKIGSRIWEMLEQPLSFKILVNKLIEEYDISEQQCTIDILIFLNNLANKKLIKVI